MAQNRSNFADAYREVNEKLKPSDGAGAYIDDFRKSDAPQFKGKSDKKIQKIAVAAYLDDKDKAKKEDKDMDPAKHVARSKKNPDKFCVFDKDGNEVKLFDKKDDAVAYAKANHDKLMEELEESQVFVVRFTDPKNKKRFAVPYKDKNQRLSAPRRRYRGPTPPLYNHKARPVPPQLWRANRHKPTLAHNNDCGAGGDKQDRLMLPATP